MPGLSLDGGNQLGRRESEGLGELENDAQSGRFHAPLKLAHIGPVEASTKAQFFLRDAEPLA